MAEAAEIGGYLPPWSAAPKPKRRIPTDTDGSSKVLMDHTSDRRIKRTADRSNDLTINQTSHRRFKQITDGANG